MDRVKAIILAAENDKSSFWTIMKSKPRAPTISAIPMSEWENHFQNLLNCENSSDEYHIFHSDHDYSQTLIEKEILNRASKYSAVLTSLPIGKLQGAMVLPTKPSRRVSDTYIKFCTFNSTESLK